MSSLDVRFAARALAAGGVIAHPTESVWGLACDPQNRDAVERLLRLKNRPVSKGLILVSGDEADFSPLLDNLTAAQLQQLHRTWPGPVTWLVPHFGRVPPWISGDHHSVALRCTDHPFTAALQIVAKEVPDPLGSEMGVISDEAAYGRDVAEALKSMAERIDMQDLRFLAVAVTIQQQSGGNLAEILEGLAKVIRARFRLFRRVKAITAEAQWSGKFLSGFPVFVLLAIQVLDPHYYDEVLDHAFFIPACFAVAIFLVLNLIVMKILVNIKV